MTESIFKVRDLVKKAAAGELLDREDLEYLFRLDHHSPAGGLLMGAADELSRSAGGGRAEIHTQIGLNLAPCPRNCRFCAFAAVNGVFREKSELSPEEAVEMARRAEAEGPNAVFLMATADYSFGRFVEIGREIRSRLKPETVLIANVGDFDEQGGRRLKEAGFAGIYHAVRLGEGRDTPIPPEKRLATFRAAREADLRLGTCVEPVGPEHTAEELAEKTLIGREARPCYSGAARRISIPGTSLENHGMVSESRMAYLVAVVRLAMGPEVIGNCTHEPNVPGAAAGANLFWAEVGSNPRDTSAETSKGRGLGVEACRKILEEADYRVLDGPSKIYG
ncbi:MAG: radical SAM protein [Candidatus Erginobacter occultus]|nr:radical SAM protein [Candidatus Erginobacter occultus]